MCKRSLKLPNDQFQTRIFHSFLKIMTELRASLRNSAGSTTWDMPPNAGENIPGGIFNKVVVSQGKWIFYNNDYNLNDGRSVVVDEGEGEIDLGFFCESAREIKHAADGIALFEHYKYRGVTKVSSNTGQEVMFSPAFVCLFVCLSPGYLKTYYTDFHERLWKGWP